MEDVLVCEDVRRRYGDHVALDGVSLSIEAGEVFCLIGPNGAGKTTLVRALCGTTEFEGRVSVFGSSPTAVDRSRVGLLPQEFSPPTRLTAREILTYYAGLYDDARDPGVLLSDLGLADSADTRYEDLSGGQRRRVCVGAALVNDPEVLFLDEPTTAIDPAGRRALWRLLEDLVAGGTTIFLTTHDMAEAKRLADRVGLLAEGRLAEVGTPAELIAAHGGESRLTVETSDRPEAGANALRGAGHRIEVREDDIAVYDVAPESIGAVVADLSDLDIDYDALAWSHPTLEDAYLRLTGTAVGRGGDPIDSDSGSDAASSTEIPTSAEPGRTENADAGGGSAEIEARSDGGDR
jgi:ABC-2 type transport system ATP-binding protein